MGADDAKDSSINDDASRARLMLNPELQPPPGETPGHARRKIRDPRRILYESSDV